MMKTKDFRRELDQMHRALEGAHNRINSLLEGGGEAKGLRSLCVQLQDRVDRAHSRLDVMSEALCEVRADAALARVQAANQEQRMDRLVEQLRQDGVSLGHEALKLVGQLLPTPSSPLASP